MDIRYLLLLQDFRNSINDALTPFMEMISLFAVTYLILAPAYVYWCIDKKKGLYILASYTTTVAVNAVIKLCACVYRPWIRDPRVVPAGDAITTATGYSFPSGHTATAVPIYGGFAVAEWNKMRWISVLSVICIAVTCFSRNYLGVHTPQDVLVALVLGIAVLWSMKALFGYLEEHPEKEDLILCAGIIAGTAAIVFITFKNYPMDYVDGELLVDPQKMMKDGYGDIGMLIGFCLGRLIEKSWIRFEPDQTKESLAAGICGVILCFFLIQTIGAPLTDMLGSLWGKFMTEIIIVLFIMAGWPAVMKMALSKTSGPDERPESV